MKVLLSWIREFVDVPESAEEIGKLMSVRGLALEGLEPHGDDVVMDFDVTANRPDCLSMIGIAREIATAYQPAASSDGSDGLKSRRSPNVRRTIPVTIEDPELCPRYAGAVADVTVGPSPQWMQDRLTACGIRSISNIVDITNYVLLELGQPMHAFDLDKLAGGAIVVRRAKPGESITTLDGKQRTLKPDMLVIADAVEGAGHWRRDGRRGIGSVGHARRASSSRPRTSSPRRCAPPARRWASRPTPRRASSAAWTSPRRRAPWRAPARCSKQIGAGKATGTIARRVSRAAASRRRWSSIARACRACSAWTCRMRTSSGF